MNIKDAKEQIQNAVKANVNKLGKRAKIETKNIKNY